MLRRYSTRPTTVIPSWLPLKFPERLAALDFRSAQVQQDIKQRLSDQMERSSNTIAKMEKRYKYERDAAVLIPLCSTYSISRPKEYESSVLFTVRSKHLRKHAGEVSFPGGLFDHELDVDISTPELQKDMVRTVVRETVEELPSIQPEDIEILGRLPPVPDKTGTIRVSPFVAYLKKPIWSEYERFCTCPELKMNESEVSDVFTISVKELFDPERIGLQSFNPRFSAIPFWRVTRQKIESNIEFNYVEKDGIRFYRIWGLSAYVLNELIRGAIVPQLNTVKVDSLG